MLDIVRTICVFASDFAGQLASGAHLVASVGLAAMMPVSRRSLHAAPSRVGRSLAARNLPLAPARPLGPRQPDPAHDHINRVSNIVRASIDRAERTSALHDHATTKLDAAEYALNRLMDELSTVMSTPISLGGRVGGSPRASASHQGGLSLAA